MKVYIQARQGMPCNHNFYNAYQGFHEMGIETIFFDKWEELRKSLQEDIVVGYVNTVRNRLFEFGIQVPEVNYPEELQKYMGRKTWFSKINTINSHPELWPVFVKPIQNKRFTGVVVRSPKDLVGCGSYHEDIDVICSEVLTIKAEWRVFIRYDEILDVRPYKGDWRAHYNPNIIDMAVKEFTNAPAGYAIDFGVTDKGETVLIEVNDGYALGSYGLLDVYYAKLLSARWAELTKTVDECNF